MNTFSYKLYSNSSTSIPQFWELCADSKHVCESTFDSLEQESTYRALLDFVRSHPEDRHLFVYCFIHLLHWPNLGPFNLIEYCMRELRWPEVQDHLLGIAKVTPELNCLYIVNRILAAFIDPWVNADIYVKYRKPQSEKPLEFIASPH